MNKQSRKTYNEATQPTPPMVRKRYPQTGVFQLSAANHLELLITHVKRAFQLTEDLVENLSDGDLAKNLENIPSNTIGEQLWCVVGARESYLNAIAKNGRAGFSCSLKNTTAKTEVLACLQKSRNDCFSFFEQNELNLLKPNFY